MSADDVTPERFAELRLLEKHLCASGQMVGACLRESLDALESAWAERDAYLEEVLLTNENEARIMADLIATREECDRLRAQGGEMPDLDNYETRPCEPCVANEGPEDWCAIAQWESERADAWKAFAQLQARPTPPHPDTVEVDEEYLTDLEDSVRQLMGEKMEIEWDLSSMPERIKQARALRSAQAQPTNETRG